MRITSAGAIEIKGSSTTANAQAFITNDNSVLTIGSSVSGSVVNDISFNSPSAMMYIDGSTANVGIGTSSPTHKLEVVGNIATRVDQKIGWVYNPGTDNNLYNYLKTASDGGVSASHLEISGANWTSGNTKSIEFTHATTGDLMTIMTHGNVGIGTDAPARKLCLYEDSSAQTQIQFQNSTTGVGSNDGFAVGLDASEKGFLYHYEGGDIYMETGSALVYLQNSGGGVGIGTTNPQALFNLSQANGANIRFDNPTTSKYFTIGEGVGTAGVFSFRGNSYQSTDTLSVDFVNDRVGVGVIAPIVPFHVVGTAVNNPSNAGGGYEVMQVFDNTSANTGVGGGIGLGGVFNSSGTDTIFSEIRGIKENSIDSNYAGALTFSTRTNGANITERMRITSAGNVGINKSAPNNKFHVHGGGIEISSFTNNAGFVMDYGNATGTINFMNLKSNGVSANIGQVQRQSPNEADLFLGGSGGKTMTLTSGKNVGIGTDSPTQHNSGRVLHIHNPSGNSAELHLSDNGSGSASGDGSVIHHNSTNLYIQNHEAGNLQFYNNGAERMRIDLSLIHI